MGLFKIMEKKHIRPQLVKSTFRMNLRHFLYEVVTYVFDKLGLIDKLKFPKSAYIESRDIPYSKQNQWIRGK